MKRNVEFTKNDDKYYFSCPCGNMHEMGVYPIAKLASGNDLTYTCQ